MPADRGVRFDLAGGLVEAPGDLLLPALARICRKKGFFFPLARPVPALRLADACARLPILVEGFVASCEAVASSGGAVETPRAPRAAQGPDLLGALALRAPLARATRVRLRVFDQSRTASFHERLESADAAARRLVGFMDEGRAFVLDALRGENGVTLQILSGVGHARSAHLDGVPGAPSAFAHQATLRASSSRMLLPADARAVARALEEGCRVVGAPFMGRLGTLEPGRSLPDALSASDAASALARALAQEKTDG